MGRVSTVVDAKIRFQVSKFQVLHDVKPGTLRPETGRAHGPPM